LEGGGRWRGPGHCAILGLDGEDKIVYHAYDAEARGVPTLRISPLKWDAEGWPAVAASGSPLAAYAVRRGARQRPSR
jgi:arabinan endo-1,5-alpha-L-arabinosidase